MASTVDFENMRQIEQLRTRLGDAECRRLGFIFDDERGVTVLSTAGFGFLLYLETRGVTSVAEAFAAGYQCAAEFHTVALAAGDVVVPANSN